MKVIYFLFLSFIFFNTNVLAQKVTYSYVFRIQEITSYAEAKPYIDFFRSVFNPQNPTANSLVFFETDKIFKFNSLELISENKFLDILKTKSLNLDSFDFQIIEN
jgi:hypothetical protein